jgi:hypothetical protein
MALPIMNEMIILDRIDALLAQMTPEEKAGQLTQFFEFVPNGEAL